MTRSAADNVRLTGATDSPVPGPPANLVEARPTLLVGGAGKTGRRVARRLAAHGIRSRAVSRSTEVPFDWEDERTWPAALDGGAAAHLAFQPDLAVPWAADVVGRVAALAASSGVERLTLVSGRGEEGAERAEEAVLSAHPNATVARCAWFAQNFSEGLLAGAVAAGAIPLPVPPDVPEPFVDLEDVADVLALALLGELPGGAVHDLTGPEALTMDEAAAVLTEATRREVRFTTLSRDDFVTRGVADGLDRPTAEFLATLFGELLDGRNVTPTSTVPRLLGRPAGSLAEFAARSLADRAAAGDAMAGGVAP